jgi:ABC-type antimicrobial peptide transport system permease subunit
MALGCTPPAVMGLVVGRAAQLALAGLAVGVLLSMGAMRWMGSILYGTKPTGTAGYLIAAGAIALVTLLAATLPALRAARIDPAIALRQE